MKRTLLMLCVLGLLGTFLALPVSAGVFDSVVDMATDSGDEAASDSGLAEDTTFHNTARNFSFTIPAGWALQSGDPNSDTVIFMVLDKGLSFQFNYTAMTPDFPAEASVSASLTQSKQEVTTGKYLSAERRDDDAVSDGLGAIGWQVMESPTGGGGDHQRIIWQCYDKDNYYYNFMAAAPPANFSDYQQELMGIIESIHFHK